MHAVLSGGLRLPAATFFTVGGSRKYLLDREIADGHVWFTLRRPNCLISMSSIGSEGGRSGRPRRNSPPSDRSTKKPNKLNDKSADESSKSTQREIIALFKRIQTSIAEGPDASKKRRPKSLREKQPAESVIEAPHRYLTKNQPREKDSSQVPRRSPWEHKQETQTHSMMSRPVSNFVKRSPIPLVTSSKEETESANAKNPSAIVPKQSELQRIDELKLRELKELAKSKGIRGYSKLKKRELVEMLKGLAQP